MRGAEIRPKADQGHFSAGDGRVELFADLRQGNEGSSSAAASPVIYGRCKESLEHGLGGTLETRTLELRKYVTM